MTNKSAIWSLLVAASICALLGGCGKGGKILLAYERPSQYHIPAAIKRIGIAEFGGMSRLDRKWGQIASDRLAWALDAHNRVYHRYELVERQRLKAILDEQDLQMAISDTDSASTAGKLADVQAMIYGNAKITVTDQRRSRQFYDAARKATRTVYYTHRYCLVAVNFTMDDITTGKTLATVSTMREYDSDRDASSGRRFAMAMGYVSDNLPAAEQIIRQQIDQCVGEFLRKISPHQVTVTIKLRRGNSKITNTANTLAVAGEYAEALQYYQQALELKPEDHGMTFNAGVMNEALGRLEEAEQYYDRAFRIKDKEDYLAARNRVRAERTRGGGQ